MQAIRRILPRFAQTLSHGPQAAQRPSIPAHSLLQRRLYTDDVKPRAFPYWSQSLLKEEHLRALPYKDRLAYIVAKSANVDVAPSPSILIRGLQPSIKFLDIETSSLLSGNVGISGSAEHFTYRTRNLLNKPIDIRKGFLYVEFPSQEAASDVVQKINNATEYPFAVEGGSSNIVVPVYAEYAKNNEKREPTPVKVLYVPEYRGTLDDLRAMLEPFSQGHLEISERTITDKRHIWVDLGSIENAKSALEACARRTYGYGDGKEAIIGIYYARIRRT